MTLIYVDDYARTVHSKELMKMADSVIREHTTFIAVLYL